MVGLCPIGRVRDVVATSDSTSESTTPRHLLAELSLPMDIWRIEQGSSGNAHGLSAV